MLRERGLTDLSLVVCDPWSVHMAPTDLAAGKLIQLFMYFRTEPNDNHYAHPLDFTPIVDLYQKKVHCNWPAYDALLEQRRCLRGPLNTSGSVHETGCCNQPMVTSHREPTSDFSTHTSSQRMSSGAAADAA